jgi:hypothetical protein
MLAKTRGRFGNVQLSRSLVSAEANVSFFEIRSKSAATDTCSHFPPRNFEGVRCRVKTNLTFW